MIFFSVKIKLPKMLGKLIGKGSDGEVYEIMNHQKYVVKYIQPKIGGIHSYLEYYILLYNKHPNILNAVSIETTENNLVKIILPRALEDLSKTKKRFRYQKNKHIFSQIVSGIDYLHAYNIVHGDIKPANILLFPNNQVMINDLSLACFSESVSGNSVHLYTYHYRAPEVENGGYSLKSDIYALGCTLYEIYFGTSYHNKKYRLKTHPLYIVDDDNRNDKLFLDLIHNMTILDLDKRYDIHQVKAHSFFETFRFKKYENKCIRQLKLNDISDSGVYVSKCLNKYKHSNSNDIVNDMDQYTSNVIKFDILNLF